MIDTNSSSSLLGSTAAWTAAARALESSRPDPLFNDPWAAELAGQEGAQWMAARTPESVVPIILRTRFFDDFLLRVTRENAIRQVVLLAAGFDTRAYRLQWPANTQLFEMDQPQVLERKEQILSLSQAQPNCERISIGQDLTGPWQTALIDAGFLPQEPSLWLLEGFLFYLPSVYITSLVKDVSRLTAPASWLGFDIINSIMLTHPLTKGWIEMQAASGAPWIGTLDDPAGFLAEFGWKTSLSQAGQPDAHHGRWTMPVLPTHMPGVPHNWFVTAQKNEEARDSE